MQPTTTALTQSLRPELRFTPYAWAKLLFMCHTRGTEVSGMGIGAEDDPMTIEDILIIKQKCNAAFTKFDADAYADKMLDLCDPEGQHKLAPSRCQRVWIHTHPAGVGRPSLTDDKTFEEAFGLADWAIMFIYSKSKDVYCQLRITARGTNGQATEFRQELPVDIAWNRPFPAADPKAWAAELAELVGVETPYTPPTQLSATGVMPVVRTGVVLPPPPPTAPLKLVTYTPPIVTPPRTNSLRPQKTRLMPMAGSLLAGLSSQQLTRLLTTDISEEGLKSGGILHKLEKNGWELTAVDVPVNNLPGTKSLVYFWNKAIVGTVFGSRDMALADRMVLTASQPERNRQDLALAEFDLQVVAEERKLGEIGHRDSFGLALDAVFPWHVPGRALLFLSLNELEEVLLTLESPPRVKQVPSGLVLSDWQERDIRESITRLWSTQRYKSMGTERALDLILDIQYTMHPSLREGDWTDTIKEWIQEEMVRLPAPVIPPDTLYTRVVPEDLEKAKEKFRELLTTAQKDGWTVPDIDLALSVMYDKAFTGRWTDEYCVLLKHIRANGYNLACLDQPILPGQQTLQLTEGAP